MDVYKVQLGEGPDKVFDQDISVDWTFQKGPRNDAGKVEFTEVFFRIRGEIIDSTAELVMDGVQDKITEIIDKLLPTRVRIDRNGTTEFDFTPGASLEGTPTVESFSTVPADGQGEGHWEFEMDIYVKLPGNLFGGAKKITTNIETTKDRSGQVIQRIWRVSITHRTFQQALNLIPTFKPTGDVQETIGEFPQEARATATWIWEFQQLQEGAKVLEVRERISLTNFGPDLVPDTQVSEEGFPIPPILHEAVGVAGLLLIEGTTFSLEKGIAPPAPHYSGVEGITRVPRRERTSFPVLTDPIRGIYSLDWQEAYLVTAGLIPAPTHGDHFDRVIVTPPAKGAIVGSA